MAQLLVRDLDERLVTKLKERAKASGLSAEEEHRRILKRALARAPERKPTLMEFLISGEAAVESEEELDLSRSREVENRDVGF